VAQSWAFQLWGACVGWDIRQSVDFRFATRYFGVHADTAQPRYIHRNPSQRGLCEAAEQWRRSSFRNYVDGCDVGAEIESKWTARNRSAAVLGNQA
jgi:hypothetical protein